MLGKEQKVKDELLVQQVRLLCRELPPCLLSSLRSRGKLQGKHLNVNHSLGLGYTDFRKNVTHSTGNGEPVLPTSNIMGAGRYKERCSPKEANIA